MTPSDSHVGPMPSPEPLSPLAGPVAPDAPGNISSLSPLHESPSTTEKPEPEHSNSAVRPPVLSATPQAQLHTLAEQIAFFDSQLILAERMRASVSNDHAERAMKTLTDEETATFTGLWSHEILGLVLSAGVTVHEVRQSLRTGMLPDKGSVQFLSAVRAATPSQP